MNKLEKITKIVSFLEKYKIENTTVNKDFTVDVDGDIWLYDKDLNEIPFQFGRVNGNFNIGCNKLTSLIGCPSKINGIFDCAINQLTSLEGCPKEVRGVFNCCNNNLTSLIGAPEYVGDNFYCNNNKLTSLISCPRVVEGNFDCRGNHHLKSLEGIGEVKGKIYSDFFNGYLED